MSARRWSVEEYFALEKSSEIKHEYIDGEIFAMSGGTPQHGIIMLNAGTTINTQLRDRDCFVYPSDVRVKIDARKYVYPDLSVVCGEPQFEQMQGMDILVNPTLIVEVLSSTTEVYDRGTKLELYRRIESLQEYVLIAQDRPRIEHYRRHADGQWIYDDAMGLEAALELASIGCTLRLADVYQKVTFEPEADE